MEVYILLEQDQKGNYNLFEYSHAIWKDFEVLTRWLKHNFGYKSLRVTRETSNTWIAGPESENKVYHDPTRWKIIYTETN